MIERAWRRGRVYRILSLGGYVAFNLPRVVTALGSVLVLGLAVAHVYVLVRAAEPPAYFVVYSAALITVCALTVVALWSAFNPGLPQHGWQLGSLLCAVYGGLYLVNRAASCPDWWR